MDAFLDRLDIYASGIWLPLLFCMTVLLFVVFMPKRQINWLGIYLTFGVVGCVGVLLDINILENTLISLTWEIPVKRGLGT